MNPYFPQINFARNVEEVRAILTSIYPNFDEDLYYMADVLSEEGLAAEANAFIYAAERIEELEL